MKKILNYIKKIFSNRVIQSVFISLITIVITLVVLAFLFWHFRTKIFNYITDNFIKPQQIASNNLVSENKVSETSIEEVKAPVTVVDAVKKAKPAVVSIVLNKQIPKYEVTYKNQELIPGFSIQTPVYTQNGTEKKQVGSGSGFLISSTGLIVTNKHVVEGGSDMSYAVLLNNGKEYDATVLAKDSILDVAILKITASNLPYLELGDSSKIEVGESVIAIGNALGEFKNTVSVGVVSGLSRSITASDNGGQFERLDKVIQTDAAINPGNSGGPLLNLEGEVVGINVAVAEGSSNVGFSLPINSVKGVIDQVKRTGKITRPYVGIRYVVIDQALKNKFNLLSDHGILIYRGDSNEPAVVSGSPAEKGGLKEGDIIISINGTVLNDDNDFASIVRTKKVGETIKMKVISNGIEKIVSVKLEATSE